MDDRPKRYDRLMGVFAGIGISRSQIDLVTCTSAAREKMGQRSYDLLILDILVPLWPEGEEATQHSADLLFEIREGEISNSPGHILGITADRDVGAAVFQDFEAYTWTVLEYAADNDEWISRATNCAKYILNQLQSTEGEGDRPVDVAIICALAMPEMEEVLKLPWNWSAARPIDDMVFVHDGWFEAGGRVLSVCATSSPRMGMVSTALRTATMVERLRPQLVAMTGICAGVRGKVKLGDVLFADPSWDFQSGKRVKDKENTQFSMRPHHLPASAQVRSHIEQLRGDKVMRGKIATEFSGIASGIPEIHVGPVASGSAVLADGEVIKEIRTQHQELIGVEMEIYGLYAAAHAASRPQPQYFALKGVCDFADPDKEDGHQHFAAYASARVLQQLLERYGHRLVLERS
ncbi:5'-methylthioadenosine/S-adenosylhomocysteine nucleosidase family protein [Sphingobium yanoikuyae]